LFVKVRFVSRCGLFSKVVVCPFSRLVLCCVVQCCCGRVLGKVLYQFWVGFQWSWESKFKQGVCWFVLRFFNVVENSCLSNVSRLFWDVFPMLLGIPV
jgi:hypothetical protein